MAESGQSSGAAPSGAPGKGPVSKRDDLAQLTGIGLGGGFFSGLFGVGGGTVMVPAMVLWRGFAEKRATGTSLLAIVVIAIFGVVGNEISGSVNFGKGILIGIPAVGGVVAGTALQQRISDRMLSGMFAVLMIAIATLYIVRA